MRQKLMIQWPCPTWISGSVEALCLTSPQSDIDLRHRLVHQGDVFLAQLLPSLLAGDSGDVTRALANSDNIHGL